MDTVDWASVLNKISVETTLRKTAIVRETAELDSLVVCELPKGTRVAAGCRTATLATGVPRVEVRAREVRGWVSAKMLMAPLLDDDKLERIGVASGKRVRLFVLSDLHSDKPSNMEWIKQHLGTRDACCVDVLLCAGDVSHRSAVMEETLDVLAGHFDLVVFTPGNHDAWISKGEHADSFAKLASVQEACARRQIRTGGVLLSFEDATEDDLIVLPLLSWYDDAFDTEKSVVLKSGGWVDFSLCKWGALGLQDGFRFGPLVGTSPHIAEHFASLNEARIRSVEAHQAIKKCVVVITMSHFAPRHELLPERRFLGAPHLPKVSGSRVIEAQLRRVRPHAHVFGHTHLPMDMLLDDGVRYLNWPLGSERERLNVTRVVSGSGILMLRDGREWAPPQWTFWCAWYAKTKRDPTITKPAPWAREAQRRHSGEQPHFFTEEDEEEAPYPRWPLDRLVDQQGRFQLRGLEGGSRQRRARHAEPTPALGEKRPFKQQPCSSLQKQASRWRRDAGSHLQAPRLNLTPLAVRARRRRRRAPSPRALITTNIAGMINK